MWRALSVARPPRRSPSFDRFAEDSSPANGTGDDGLRPGLLQSSSATPVIITALLSVTLAGLRPCELRRDVDDLLLLPFTGLLEPR